MPADIKPLIKARLIMRDTLSESRPVTTDVPAPTKAPNAAPSLAPNSGLISTFDRPVTRESVTNSSLSQRSSHTRLLVTIEPSSIILSGQILIFESSLLFFPIEQESLIKTFSITTVSSSSMHLFPTTHCDNSERTPMVVSFQMTEFRITAPA